MRAFESPTLIERRFKLYGETIVGRTGNLGKKVEMGMGGVVGEVKLELV